MDEYANLMDEYANLKEWSKSLSDEQIDFLWNNGFYNYAMIGYLIDACENLMLRKGQIIEVYQGLNKTFFEKDKKAAEEIYCKFFGRKI